MVAIAAVNDRVHVLFGTNNLVERLVDEIAEPLMPLLANNGDDDALELLPDLPQPGPKPDQPG